MQCSLQSLVATALGKPAVGHWSVCNLRHDPSYETAGGNQFGALGVPLRQECLAFRVDERDLRQIEANSWPRACAASALPAILQRLHPIAGQLAFESERQEIWVVMNC